MGPRSVAVAFGTGITTFLVVAVLVIELLAFEFSALVGLPVGVVAGAVAVVVVLLTHDDLGDPLRWAVAAAAGFGYGIAVVLAARYVNLVDVGFAATVGIAVAAGVVALAGAAVGDRRRTAG